MGHQNGAKVGGSLAQASKTRSGVTDGEAAVNHNTGITPLDDGGITFTAAAQGSKSHGAICPRTYCLAISEVTLGTLPGPGYCLPYRQHGLQQSVPLYPVTVGS